MRTLLCSQKVYDNEPVLPSRCYGEITNSRVLDIGCGTGNLGKFLKQQGNQCFGITVSGEEAEMARKKLDGVAVVDVEIAEALPFQKEYFDVIILADVLEHLRDPVHILKLVKQYLRPSGWLIVSIPNVANLIIRINLLRGRFDYDRVGILDSTHLRFYTMKSACSLLTSTGYEIKETKFTNTNWRFPKWIAKPLCSYEWEIRERMTRWWPSLLATQFVFYAKAVSR